MSKTQTFEAFSQAVRATASELGAVECDVFRDDDMSFSAALTVIGRDEPRNAEESGATQMVVYSINLAMTYGHDTVDVFIEYQDRNLTSETRLSALETKASDVFEPICRKIGIQAYA